MTKLIIRQAVRADAYAINLCQQDRLERALWGREDPEKFIADVIDLPEHKAHTVALTTQDGQLLALGGATVLADGVLAPWLLLDERAADHKQAVLRFVMKRWSVIRDLGLQLMNYVGKDCHEAQEFLRRLGFRVTTTSAGCTHDIFTYIDHV